MIGRGCLSAVLVTVALACAWPTPTYAGAPPPNGTLYRCKAPNGEIRFTNVAAHGCVVIGTYKAKPVNGALPDSGVPVKDGWALLTKNSEEEVRWNPSRTKLVGGRALTWLMFRYVKPQGQSMARYRKLVSQTYIDCAAGSLTMNVGYWYDSADIVGGNVVSSSNLPSSEVPPPGSTGDQVLQSLCDAPSTR